MPITATCTGCGKPLKIKDELVGKTIRCPSCKTSFVAAARPGMSAARQPSPHARTPKLHIAFDSKFVILGILALVIGGVLLTWTLGPGAVMSQWSKQHSEAEDDVASVVDRLIQAHLSAKGKYNPRKPAHVPRSISVDFVFPPLAFSMPKRVGFNGVSSEGAYHGFYYPATHEIEADVDLGGTGLITGIVYKQGTSKVSGTGRVKDGAVTAEIDGKPAEIIMPPKSDDD